MRHPGRQLRAFREARGLSLREAARQLHVVHPALKDWEDEHQSPSAPYRDAIEVWTHGAIPSACWPVSDRERDIALRAAAVRPADEVG
jgi:transcriptional regulator with XRE-family HTH domain